MYSRSCFDDIRLLEAALYEGPESAERIFGREESYQSPHENRRSLEKYLSYKNGTCPEPNAWYRLVYFPEEKKFVKEFFKREKECEK